MNIVYFALKLSS